MISPRTLPRKIQTEVRRALHVRSQPTNSCTAFCVGICGSGMKALAELLSGLGWTVTGSDLRPSNSVVHAMRKRGLRVHRGHDVRYLPPETSVLIYSSAVGPDNPERQLARQLSIPELSYSKMLGELMRDRTGISIAGTHGKSTTTAMVATILEDAGLSPSAVIGADLCDKGIGGWAGTGQHIVVESCEYRRSFLDFSPAYAAILGIEHDHFDYYHDLEQTKQAFREFVENVPDDGVVLAPADCAATMSVVQSARAPVVTFSREPNADWWATDLRPRSMGSRFRIFHRGQYFTEVLLQIPGSHNIRNALAATAIASQVGVSPATIRESLEEFSGIRRRFQQVGSWRGVTFIDDYAHHPTATLATLQTARQQFPNQRIWCVFQPHQVSRTQNLLDEFAVSFADADRVLIAPIFAAREENSGSAEKVVQELVQRIGEQGQTVQYLPSLDQLVATLEDDALPGDVVITMGAGDIDRIHHEFTRRLRRHPSTR